MSTGANEFGTPYDTTEFPATSTGTVSTGAIIPSLPEYFDFAPILDRLLVRRNKAEEIGDGFDSAIPEKYRQHSNWGMVVAIGTGVVLGQQHFPLEGFVAVGDQIKYGEYTAEQFDIASPDLFIIRIQDVRGVKRLKRG